MGGFREEDFPLRVPAGPGQHDTLCRQAQGRPAQGKRPCDLQRCCNARRAPDKRLGVPCHPEVESANVGCRHGHATRRFCKAAVRLHAEPARVAEKHSGTPGIASTRHSREGACPRRLTHANTQGS